MSELKPCPSTDKLMEAQTEWLELIESMLAMSFPDEYDPKALDIARTRIKKNGGTTPWASKVLFEIPHKLYGLAHPPSNTDEVKLDLHILPEKDDQGWYVEYKFLEKISEETKKYGFCADMEQVESVILSLYRALEGEW